MPDYNEGEGQFAHIWKPGEDDIGNKAEISETPAGKYTVTKGAGKLKWAVTHDSGWEALGGSRKEVRAEADKDIAERLKKKDS